MEGIQLEAMLSLPQRSSDHVPSKDENSCKDIAMCVITMYRVGYLFPNDTNLAVEVCMFHVDSSFRVQLTSRSKHIKSSRVSFYFAPLVRTTFSPPSALAFSFPEAVPTFGFRSPPLPKPVVASGKGPKAALSSSTCRPVRVSPDTRDLEVTSGIQLCCLVQILREGILPT